MSDITFTDEDLKEKVDELTEKVGIVSRAKGPDRENGIAQCDELLREVRDLKKGFNIELRHMPKGEKRREYQEKLKGYDGRVQNAKDNLEWAKSQGNRQELLGSRQAPAAADPRRMNNDEMLNALGKVNTKIDVGLDRTLQDAKMGLQIGKETAATLEEQGEQMESIQQDAKEIREHLRTADVLIKNFAKRMATDRVIQCFLFVVVILIVVIIVYAAMNPDQDTFSVPDEAKPPLPQNPTPPPAPINPPS
eukprot:g3657.t1